MTQKEKFQEAIAMLSDAERLRVIQDISRGHWVMPDSVSLLSDVERLEISQWLAEDYCSECGAVAFCDCEKCICECRKRRVREFRERLEKSGKTFNEWLAENGELV